MQLQMLAETRSEKQLETIRSFESIFIYQKSEIKSKDEIIKEQALKIKNCEEKILAIDLAASEAQKANDEKVNSLEFQIMQLK